MAATRDDIIAALSAVVDPATGKDIVASDMVRALDVEAGAVRFVLEVPAERGAELEPVRSAAEAAAAAVGGVTSVSALMTAHAAPAAPNLKIGRHPEKPSGPAPVPGVRTILAVGSGKGGVGKSTVSANLAVAMAQQGLRVGLLDADLYGPSQPRIMGIEGRPRNGGENRIIPLTGHGVTVMSIGFMVQEDEAVVWRGPMLMGALQQFLGQVVWGELDVLIVDLPPGTGDIQLTLAQKAQVTGAIVVSTPQDVALLDAKKALAMFEKLSVPVMGVVENMSSYICPDCGREEHIFGHGGAEAEAQRRGVPFLGRLPLDLQIRLASDEGEPVVVRDPDGPQAAAFKGIAAALAEQIRV